MNLPNKLTVLRMCLIPFFVIFMEYPFLGGADKYIAVAIFIIASITLCVSRSHSDTSPAVPHIPSELLSVPQSPFGKDFILCILCCTGSWNIKSFIQTGTLRERVP